MSMNERNTSLLTTVLGVVAALLVMLTVGILLQGWTLRQLAEEERAKIIDRPYPELETYVREQEQKLAVGYEWLDQERGIVHLPIERAMALVVQELGGAPASASGPDGSSEDGTPQTEAGDSTDTGKEETGKEETGNDTGRQSSES